LQRIIKLALVHPEKAQRLGVAPPAGALLYGPSGNEYHESLNIVLLMLGIGCGKTALVREAISLAAVRVISVSGQVLCA
jgi:SpoVK/Ycf46/Vps4 family AAA+-type ATPase